MNCSKLQPEGLVCARHWPSSPKYVILYQCYIWFLNNILHQSSTFCINNSYKVMKQHRTISNISVYRSAMAKKGSVGKASDINNIDERYIYIVIYPLNTFLHMQWTGLRGIPLIHMEATALGMLLMLNTSRYWCHIQWWTPISCLPISPELSDAE